MFLKALTGLSAAAWMFSPPWPKTRTSKISRKTTSLISAMPSRRAEMWMSKYARTPIRATMKSASQYHSML